MLFKAFLHFSSNKIFTFPCEPFFQFGLIFVRRNFLVFEFFSEFFHQVHFDFSVVELVGKQGEQIREGKFTFYKVNIIIYNNLYIIQKN